MEVKNGEEPVLASKRGADLSPSAFTTTIELKKQRIENPEGEELKNVSENLDEEKIDAENTADGEKVSDEKDAVEGQVEAERGEEDGDSNGKAVIDRKGKGILIEEEEEDEEGEDDDDDSDDDDSSDGGNVSENGSDDSDFSDDPLAEVDLDNILPSRTRRRVIDPSAYIANPIGGADEDSEDSDA